MKKFLFVTGRNAKEGLEEVIKKNKLSGKIHLSNVDVASFITPKILLKELSKKELEGIESIILPGNVSGDFSIIEKNFKVKCIKGPTCYHELPYFLKFMDSKKRNGGKNREFSFLLKKIRGEISLKNSFNLPYIIAEINNAPRLKRRELIKKVKYYELSGADILDIGMIANEDNSEKIPEIIKIVRENSNLPISIDTLNRKEILTAIEFGIDLIISVDFSNYSEELIEKINTPLVIIPRDENGNVPKKAEDRINLIENLINLIKEKSRRRIVVDLILEPLLSNFSESLKAFILFREKYPKIPLLMGVGNVIELMDVDSVGVNGLLAGIASELKVNFLLTTEASQKTKNSIRELSIAREMMYIAKNSKKLPKDLGIDLLILKDKYDFNAEIGKTCKFITESKFKDIPIIEIDKKKKRIRRMDKGFFKIFLDYNEKKINLLYYEGKKLILRFKGSLAENLYKEVISRGLIKNLEHAAYLGKELMKAEIALKLGKNYIQDENLF